MTRSVLTHNVPYYAQYESAELIPALIAGTSSAADDPRWRDSGAESREEYAFWAPRTCGVACLRMIRHAETEAPPSRGGHLVLAVGADEEGLLIHNPSGLPGVSAQSAEVSWARLAAFYAGRGVLLG
ncbi:hypothetical protein [Microlunatus sp. GCM10028923]|uniref:hypothetical protein n=1 Tax=Microlunatus sp. GCM10028923 TaxID=3273400 RepID=UPI00360B55B3